MAKIDPEALNANGTLQAEILKEREIIREKCGKCSNHYKDKDFSDWCLQTESCQWKSVWHNLLNLINYQSKLRENE